MLLTKIRGLGQAFSDDMVNTRPTNAQAHPGKILQSGTRKTSEEVAKEKQLKQAKQNAVIEERDEAEDTLKQLIADARQPVAQPVRTSSRAKSVSKITGDQW